MKYRSMGLNLLNKSTQGEGNQLVSTQIKMLRHLYHTQINPVERKVRKGLHGGGDNFAS